MSDRASSPLPQAPIKPRKHVSVIKFLNNPPLLGYYMVVVGSYCFASVFDAVFRGTPKPPVVLSTVALLVYSPLVVAGVMLARKSRGWRLAGALSWLPQVFVVNLGRLSYRASAIPTLEWHVFPYFGYTFSTSNHFSVTWHHETQESQLSVNVVALLAFTYLAERVWRRVDARGRRKVRRICRRRVSSRRQFGSNTPHRSFALG